MALSEVLESMQLLVTKEGRNLLEPIATREGLMLSPQSMVMGEEYK